MLERARSSIEGERELIFNHVLTRDVAYASIPRARLVDAHATVAAWMDEGVRERAEEFAEILAFHYAQAGDRDGEARYAMLAGNRHRRVFAAELAIAWYERGLAALGDGTGDAATVSTPGTDVAELRLARGQALEQLGRFLEALADYEVGLAGARAAVVGGDGRAPQLEARALAAKAHVLWLLDRYDEGGQVLPQALELARTAGPPELEARLLYTAGTMAFGRGAFAEALRFHADALESSSTIGDDEGRALALHGLCETRFMIGPIDEGLRNGRDADRVLRRLAQRPMVHHNEYMIGWLEWFTGAERALATVSSAIDGCREVGNVRDETLALNCRIQIELARADPNAHADVRRALEAAAQIGAPRAAMIADVCGGDLAAESWSFADLRRHASSAWSTYSTLRSRFFAATAGAFEGWGALLEGDESRAAASFDRAQATDLAPLDRLWAARTEFLAWESVGAADRMIRVAARSIPALDAPVWSVWLSVARTVGLALRREWTDALEVASPALAEAEAVLERRAARRLARVAWLALDALGRRDEAGRMHRRAVDAARTVAAAIDDDHRPGFLARPDVADVLGA